MSRQRRRLPGVDRLDKPGQSAAEQVALLEALRDKILARRSQPDVPPGEQASLTARVAELEAQLAEVLGSMRRAVEAAGLAEPPQRERHLRLVRDADKEAG